MTAKEFYENIHGDYNFIHNLFSDDAVILHFVKQFPSDSSFEELMYAVQKGDIKTCFDAAHRLKGLAANLAFSELFKNISELTEQLRSQTEQANPLLIQKVCESYKSIINAINILESGGIE